MLWKTGKTEWQRARDVYIVQVVSVADGILFFYLIF